MMKGKGFFCQLILIILLLLLSAAKTEGKVVLPSVFTDNMVVQRDQSIPVWGWADPGEKVKITFRGQLRSCKPGADGKWIVRLDPMSAGGPHTMTVMGKNKIVIKRIYIGEVWLCSGQSNMEMTVSECNNAEAEIASADYPEIHLFSVPFRGTSEPQQDFEAQWVECNPENIRKFSAAAYFFGRRLKEELNVPVGLIHCSWGGSSCEAWIRRSVLDSHPQYKTMLKEWDERMDTFDLATVPVAEKQYFDYQDQLNAARAAGKKPPVINVSVRDLFYIMFAVRRCPSYCYNGMLSPLIPYSMRGVIWYQGETNVPRAYQYRHLFPLLISSWREEWGQGDFSFIFVQLAPYHSSRPEPGPSDLAELREAQTMALGTPNTGMAVTIDIGDEKSQHPKNKQDVGKRLALWALSNVYGKNIVYSGPMYRSMEKRNSEIIIHFDHTGKGLKTKWDGPLRGFSIAGADQKFVWADARIIKDMVIVSSPDVPDPVAVRYAWEDNPVCNLYNNEDLPASPFRTDAWKGVTEK